MVLGETNDLVMHIAVIVHSWMGHVYLFTHNVWHAETEQKTALQRFAQDESFVRSLVDDPRYGWEKYEYYADAAHALEHHSGDLPTNLEAIPDEVHRQMLRDELEELQHKWVLSHTVPDKEAVEAEIKDIARLLSCHPIVPTGDLLGYLLDPNHSKHLTDNERRIIEMQRFQDRYGTQVIGRSKTIHEGTSHFVDRRMMMEPEIDLMGLGFDKVLDQARVDTMHDAYPIYWYSDPYALGEEIVAYAYDKLAVKVGTEVVRYHPLSMAENGDIIESEEWVEKVVDKWDRSAFHEMLRTFDDMRLFYTYLTEEFFERLHAKALGWVRKMIMVINKTMKDLRWHPALIFEGDRWPTTLEEMNQVVGMWMNQMQIGQQVGTYMGYGAPGFPVSQTTLYQMMQIIETVASYDSDKDGFKRQMLLRTGLFWLPNIKLVDDGRENNAEVVTLRHEFDPDFGPLKQGYARSTLRYAWRFFGPIRLLTMEILTDEYGRPAGPPRPYQYKCTNGETVKERWL